MDFYVDFWNKHRVKALWEKYACGFVEVTQGKSILRKICMWICGSSTG